LKISLLLLPLHHFDVQEDHIPDTGHSSSPLHPLRGYFFIGSAAFLWGVSATLGRALFTGKLSLGAAATHPIDPLILSQTRATFSLLVLLPILVISKGWSRVRLPARDLIYCFILGAFGVAVSNYFYYVAIQRTSVATAIIVQYTAPVWVLIYVVARGQQKLTAQRVMAVTMALVGIVLVIDLLDVRSGAGLRFDSYGIFAALLASFSFAFYNVGGHGILARHDRWRVLVWALAAAAAFWLAANPPWKIAQAHYAASQWVFLFGFSMISVLGAFSLYFLGLQYLEPSRAIIASCLEPVFSIVLAAVVLGELMHGIQILGIIFVLAAIVIVQWPERSMAEKSLLVEPME
jgi:drug/metabolite transporter (DMT)-like permease